MHADIFQEIGLSPNEAKIYETLIDEGEAAVGVISQKGGIHRRNVYDSINRLIEKGLVFQILGKGENQYKAVDPAKLLEIIREKETKLNSILPDLQKKYDATPHNQEAFIYRGIEGFKNYLRDILRRKKDVYFIGAKGLWFDPKLKSFLTGFLLEAQRLNIKYNHIFDAGIREKAPNIIEKLGKPYKFLPAEYSTGSALDIFGDHIATFSGLGIGEINEDITIYIIIDQTLAEGYRTWFKFMWDNLPDAN